MALLGFNLFNRQNNNMPANRNRNQYPYQNQYPNQAMGRPMIPPAQNGFMGRQNYGPVPPQAQPMPGQYPQNGYPPQNMPPQIPNGPQQGMAPQAPMPYPQNGTPLQNQSPMMNGNPNMAAPPPYPQQGMPQMPPQQAMPQQMPQMPQTPQGMPQMPPGAQQGMPQGMPPQQPAPASPVTYEPLDEKTMEQVRKLIEKKRKEEGIAAKENEKKLPSLPPPQVSQIAVAHPQEPELGPAAKSLSDFIQGEKNASLFYGRLMGLAGDSSTRNRIRQVEEESKKRVDAFSSMYSEMFGQDYTAQEQEITKVKQLKEGIEMAIDVESKSLRNLTDFYETVNNDKHLRKVNTIIHKKFCDITTLQGIVQKL